MQHNVRFSEVFIPSSIPVIKFRMDDALCDEIIQAAEPFIDSEVNCNLLNTRRTGWKVFNEEAFAPVFEKFSSLTLELVANYLENKSEYYRQGDQALTAFFRDAWVAWYGEDSFVQPHTHVGGDMFTNDYSLSAYLNLPQGKSSLTFLSNLGDATNFCIEVHKGDVLIFPSSLCHYSNDCHEGRIILSSNFRIDHQEKRND